MAPATLSPDRAAWREAVAAIADKAKAKLPECNGRVDTAVKPSSWRRCRAVAGWHGESRQPEQRHTAYHVVNGHCDCRDYEKAPHNYCKHRLSAAIARRAQELTKAKLDAATPAPSQPPPAQPDAPTGPLPEAP